MSVDGVWGFVYAGDKGIGVGALVVERGKFHGTDSGGTRYRGTIVEDPQTGELAIEGVMDVPAGTYLVGGSSAMDMPHQRTLPSFKLPPRFGELKPVTLPIPGMAIGIFKEHGSEFAPYADGFDIRPKPSNEGFQQVVTTEPRRR